MERAYDEAKYGRYSRRPYIDVVIPSLTDPSVEVERLEISPSPDWGVDYTCDELDVHRDSQG